MRDLQLQPKSRFAFFLRPLPARAGQLTLHATKFRTRMLRVVNTSAAARRCADLLLSLNQNLKACLTSSERPCSPASTRLSEQDMQASDSSIKNS